MDHSKSQSKKSKNCFTIALVLFLGVIGLCGLVYFFGQSTYKPLRDYPGANELQFTDEDNYPSRTKTITFWTEDSPEKIYRVYQRQFLLRPFWRNSKSDEGLRYAFFLGCPVGSYSIQAQRKEDRSFVTITLSTHVCIWCFLSFHPNSHSSSSACFALRFEQVPFQDGSDSLSIIRVLLQVLESKK